MITLPAQKYGSVQGNPKATPERDKGWQEKPGFEIGVQLHQRRVPPAVDVIELRDGFHSTTMLSVSYSRPRRSLG